MANSDNVLTKLHDLLLYLIPQLGKFPRDQKFLLADRIQAKLMGVQERCVRASCAGNEQHSRVRAGSGGSARREGPGRRFFRLLP